MKDSEKLLMWVGYILVLIVASALPIFQHRAGVVQITALVLALVLLGWKCALLDAAHIKEKVDRMGPHENLEPKKKSQEEETYWSGLLNKKGPWDP